MKHQVLTYFFIAVFGLFLMPENAFAFAKNETMSCCKTKPTLEKSCCGKTKSSEKESGCNGKCNKNSCTVNSGVAFVFLAPAAVSAFDLIWNSVSKKETFTYPETSILSGFYFIWSPPNIG